MTGEERQTIEECVEAQRTHIKALENTTGVNREILLGMEITATKLEVLLSTAITKGRKSK